MHVMSPEGAITDLGAKRVEGIDILGHDLAPGAVAELSLAGPWAPDWVSAIVDRKPIPYKFLAHGEKQWRQSYLGTDYGLASRENSFASTVPVMAQWRRTPQTVQSMRDLGTLLIRYGVNRTELLDSIYHGNGAHNPNGIVGDQGGHLFLLQEKNKLLALSSPVRGLDAGQGRPVPPRIDSLQMTVGFYNFAPRRDWEIYLDGKRVTALPVAARALQPITIKDGVTYLGIIPLPATNLGRNREVTISADGTPTELQGGGQASEALRIDLYNYDRPAAATPLARDSERVDAAWAGYALEMSDQSEFSDFGAFQRHFASAKVRADESFGRTDTIRVEFESGRDRLEMGFNPLRDNDPQTAVAYRLANGVSPFPAPGIVRDGPLTVQGVTGRLEKNGAVLATAPGVMSYLAAEAILGTTAAFNVPADESLNSFRLSAPGGATVASDGGIGIVYVAIRPKENRVWIDQGYSPEQTRNPSRTHRLIVTGVGAKPQVVLNGDSLPVRLVTPVTWRGQPAFAVPLETPGLPSG
jgi:hypothetical protein